MCQIEKEAACTALIRLANESAGRNELLALGPLTYFCPAWGVSHLSSNLALAISIDPDFLLKWKRVIVMGGCLFAKGNSNRAGMSRNIVPRRR